MGPAGLFPSRRHKLGYFEPVRFTICIYPYLGPSSIIQLFPITSRAAWREGGAHQNYKGEHIFTK